MVNHHQQHTVLQTTGIAFAFTVLGLELPVADEVPLNVTVEAHPPP
jgi:hypothetical protein